MDFDRGGAAFYMLVFGLIIVRVAFVLIRPNLSPDDRSTFHRLSMLGVIAAVILLFTR